MYIYIYNRLHNHTSITIPRDIWKQAQAGMYVLSAIIYILFICVHMEFQLKSPPVNVEFHVQKGSDNYENSWNEEKI